MQNYFRKYFLILICASFPLGAVVAQAQTGSNASATSEKTSVTENIFGFGLNANLATGLGFSFRHHLPLPLAYMVSGFAWKTGGGVFWDLGFQTELDLFVQEKTRFYGAAGFSYFYTDNSSDAVVHDTYNGPTRIGAGVGIELGMGSTIGLAFNLMLTSFQPTGELLPLPSASVHYYFR